MGWRRQPSYQVGDHARRASRELVVRSLQMARTVAAVLVALTIGIFVENYRYPSSFFDNDTVGPFVLSLVFVAAAFALVGLLRRWVRRLIRRNGSFIYVSCLPGDDDFDRVRFERSVDDHVMSPDTGRGSRLLAGSMRVGHPLDPTDRAGSTGALLAAFGHALRADDSKVPTNLLCNMLWPVGIEFGLRARFEPHTRLWYLPERWDADPSWYSEYRWLAGDLLDVIDLAQLRATYPQPLALEELASEVNVQQGSGSSDRELVVLELSSPLPDQRSAEAFRRMEKIEGLDTAPRTTLRLLDPAATSDGGPWRVNPKEMALRAVKAATVIHHALSRSQRVLVGARVAKPESVAIGYLLRFWVGESDPGLAARLGYINWSDASRSFEVWTLDRGQPGSVDETDEIVNLTPHTIRLVGQDDELVLEIEPGGQPARVADQLHTGPSIRFEGRQLPAVQVETGPVIDLPPPSPGRLYITSRVTAARCPDRADVVFPHDEVRQDGVIVGCRSLAVFSQGRG